MLKKKILILGKIPPPYMGPSIATEIILKSALNQHYCLIHLDTRTSESLLSMERWSLKKVLGNVKIYFRLYFLCMRERPSLALIPISQSFTGFLKDSAFIFIARFTGTRVLIHLRGSNFRNWLMQSPAIVQSFVKVTLKRTAGAIVLGNSLKYLFKDFFNDDKIFVVPNGADYLIPELSQRTDGEINILYLGNLQPSKGIEDVVQALALLNETHNGKFRADIIGSWRNDQTKAFCLQFVAEKKLPVTFHPAQHGEQKFRFLADAGIFVFTPRAPEGHPWVLVEAMASGLPVISTDQGAITESVSDGKNGFIVPVKSPRKIADCFRMLIDDADVRNRMSAESRKLYEEKFTERRMVENLIRTFDTVINEN